MDCLNWKLPRLDQTKLDRQSDSWKCRSGSRFQKEPDQTELTTYIYFLLSCIEQK